MKRVLFCASLLAVMAASCTQDEFQQAASVDNNAAQPGISFVGGEAPTTRGEISREENDGKFTYPFKWYAEQDRINVWGKYVYKGGTLVSKGAMKDESNPNDEIEALGIDEGNYATYKATKSENNAYFTAVDNDNILWFGPSATETTPAEFVAVYPTTSLITNIADGKYRISPLPSLADQTQKDVNDGSSVTERLLMVGHGTGYQENNYESVGEKVHLTLNRPFTALTVKTSGLDEDIDLKNVEENLSSYFGNLKTITVKALGYKADGDYTKDTYDPENGDIAPSYLNYGKAAFEYDPSQPLSQSQFVDANTGKAITDWSKVEDAATSVSLTINKPWSDAYNAFIAIKPVDRTAYQEKSIKENMKITYEFAGITLMADKDATSGVMGDNGFQTQNDWTSDDHNNFVGPFTLDIAKYPYLVTNGESGQKRTLIINNATFAKDIMKNNKVQWNDEEIEPTAFTTIISKTPIFDKTKDVNQYEYLKKFTSLEKLVLINDTEIPENAFDGNVFSTLETINFPKVEVIDGKAFTNFNTTDKGLKNVYLKMYPFGDDIDHILTFLNPNTLVNLDMSAAKTMQSRFPYQGFKLEGFKNLETVTIGELEVGPGAFDGCSSLTSIKGGTVTMDRNCIAAFRNTKITSIALKATETIAAYAFQNCSELVTVTTDGTQPTTLNEYAFAGCTQLNSTSSTLSLNEATTIGEYAFFNCKAWEEADLSKAQTIAQRAFNGCDALYGVSKNNRKVLNVGGQVAAGAFANNSAVEFVRFKDATSIETNILANTPKLAEVQFDQVITDFNYEIGQYSPFGTSNNLSNLILYVNPGQDTKTYNATQLLPNDPDKKITFKMILTTEDSPIVE